MKTVNSKTLENLRILLPALLFLALFAIFYVKSVYAGPYLNSAHGSSSYGVKRSASGFPADYTKGLCVHCHEQHASIDGFEPAPVPGPDNYTLFYDNYVSQTDDFCFECHKVTGTYQNPAFNNYNYSYKAGGNTAITCPVDILSAFSFINETGSPVLNCGSTAGTSHKLTDVQTFITGKWGYTANSNPCSACHNPHSAQRDPHTSGSRGWPVSLPSLHDSKDNNAWGLWGDVATERMNNYTASYQAPYRYNSTVIYEPDGSTTQDGSNLTDYVTFCTDCHNNSNTIYSTVLGRNLYLFDWNTEKHGKGNASNGAGFTDVLSPYNEDTRHVLACTDCHEPHGSPNLFLVREEVNNGDVTVLASTGNDGKEWMSLCSRCHGDLSEGAHVHPGYLPPDTGPCNSSPCHMWGGLTYRPCDQCHYHGNTTIPGTTYNGNLF